jgi:hypothetical protein
MPFLSTKAFTYFIYSARPDIIEIITKRIRPVLDELGKELG